MRRSTRSSDSARQRVAELPIEAHEPRARVRRGGPRTPLPLLPLIAVAAGVGVAYVSQSAHTTASTYAASNLAAQQQQLIAQNRQLADELGRLESSERIVSAAQQLGMRPADSWAYVSSHPVAVLPSAAPAEVAGASSNPVQQFVGALSGSAGAGSHGR